MVVGPRSWRVGVAASLLLLGCVVPEYAPRPAAPEPCSPVTCAEAHATCGEVSDGCGRTLQCGQCTGDTRCGALNTCEPASTGDPAPQPCVPVTCAAVQAMCGELADGCGATLQCGQCSGFTRCGAYNTCEVTPSRPLWGRAFEATAHAVSDADGNFQVLVTGTPMRFMRLTPAGELLGEQQLDAGTRIWLGFFRLGDEGSRFFVFNRSCGVGCSAGSLGTSATNGWTAIRVNKDGALDWAQDMEGHVSDVVAAIGGELLLLTRPTEHSDDSTLVWIDSAGARVRKLSINGAESIATDPTGHVIVGGTVRSSEASPTRRAYLSKLTPGGDVVWTRSAGGDGSAYVPFVGAYPHGSLVAVLLVFSGTVEWNGQSFSYESQPGAEARALIVQLDEDGASGWAVFDDSWTAVGAVTPASLFVAAMRKSENCLKLKVWAEDGAGLWSEPIGAGCESPSDATYVTSIAATGDTLVVAGSFGGDMDFGGGPVSGGGGFLQVHAP